MNLEMVNIKNFRSIENTEVQDCGGFNVLIGKNNSGKSNILSGIHAFFTCISDGSIVSLDPPIGEAIDYFQKNTGAPIEITLTFSLSLAERDALIRDIVTEAPQMKNAADGLDPSLRLSATIKQVSLPRKFAFVSQVVLGGTTKPGARLRDPERTILKIGDESASELHAQLSSARQRDMQIETLQSLMTNNGFQRWLRDSKSEGTRRPPFPLSYYLREVSAVAPDNLLLARLEAIIEESNSAEDVVSTVRSLVTELEEAAKIQSEPLRHKVDTFAGEETAVPAYALNVIRMISDLHILYLTERRKQIGKEEAERLLALKVRRGGPEVLRTIQDTVSALLGVNIDAFSSESVTQKRETTAELDVDNFLVQVNGSGIREALRVVLDFEFEHPSILLVEEPETHLHPALETSMMRYLRRMSASCQIFLTTHSTNFLDTADMKNVYLISKSDSTKVRLLDVEEAEAQIPRELGIRLSSFFMFDRLVFVEGPSDEDILREWASILGVNFSQANVGFVHMGGVKNFTHFATEKTLSFLTKRQVKIWFLMDRDERDDEEIVKIKDRLGDKAIVKFLNKREIENYLIQPRPVVDFIELKRQLAGINDHTGVPTETEIRQKVDECADSLKQIAIDKRVARLVCEPVYPSRTRLFGEAQESSIVDRGTEEIDRMITQLESVKGRAAEIYNEQTKAVEANWERNKTSLVPGDVLLDMVLKEYGLRFIKERDGARLAALMREDEIEHEIKAFIVEMGS